MTSRQLLPAFGQKGFTLLEVLVAVMILGLSVGALLQQFAVATRAGTIARDVTRAGLYAREKLEELKVKKEFSESTDSGSFDDGFEWETSVQLYEYEEIGAQEVLEDLRYETYRLAAVVTWRYGSRAKQVRLETLKTVRKQKWD